MDSLFDKPLRRQGIKPAPLAERVRPHSFEEIFGQDKLTGQDSALLQIAKNDRLDAIILWGPPGTGKTTMARSLATICARPLIELSAVQAGVKDLRSEIQKSLSATEEGLKAHILFIDEIHHLNKSQQDILLPALEDGSIRFIGATTENPSFTVNKAILSRCLLFKLNPLDSFALSQILKRALAIESMTREQAIEFESEALTLLVQNADGDARRALNLLAACLAALPPDSRTISVVLLESLSTDQWTRYDAAGEQHYDLVSAMIKSIRGSHPDAAIYYLARMLDAGENLMFIARRLVIAASEDIGNANPTALLLAESGMRAAHALGMPEARIILAQIVTYLASSPKSNRSYLAIDAALADVKAHGSLEVPLHLRNGVTPYMKDIGYGQSYIYAHDDLEGARKMSYLPPQLKGKQYYKPLNQGAEAALANNLSKLRPLTD